MEQDRGGTRPGGRAWPWLLLLLLLLLLIAAGLTTLAVVLWQSEAVRLIWANLWELFHSRGS
jgi:hypothetical protein